MNVFLFLGVRGVLQMRPRKSIRPILNKKENRAFAAFIGNNAYRLHVNPEVMNRLALAILTQTVSARGVVRSRGV